MPPQKKKSARPPSASPPLLVPQADDASAASAAEVSVYVCEDVEVGGKTEKPEKASTTVVNAVYELPAAVYEELGQLSAASTRPEVAAPGAPGKAMSQADYMTVVVTPKLSFQLMKRPEWETIQDIAQSELRRGFLSRFPPAMWLSSEKFSFRPALPPTHRLTEETKTLFFKIVSDEVNDERVMLGILRELERSYEAIIRRAVMETRSEALQEQFTLQEQAEEVRREQAKCIKELRKEVKSLREQMQSMQKRLFLVEQEKDHLQREQGQTKEQLQRLERQQADQAMEARAQKQEMLEQFEALRALVTGTAATASFSSSEQRSCSRGQSPESSARPVEVAMQTEKQELDASTGAELANVTKRVEQLQQQLGALQGWMLQGSQLLGVAANSAAASKPAARELWSDSC